MSVATIAKEAAEVFGAPPDLRDEISRILTLERRHGSLAALLEGSDDARRLYNAEPAAKSIFHAAYALQGKLHHFTLDTSRLVIVPGELDGLYSVVENAAGERFVQLSGAAIARSGGWLVGVQHSHFLSALEKTIESLEREDRSLAASYLFKGSERKRSMIHERSLSSRRGRQSACTCSKARGYAITSLRSNRRPSMSS